MQFDVYVCYPSFDMYEANNVISELKKRGFTCFDERKYIPAGVKYEDYIEEAIESSKCFVWLITPRSKYSTAVEILRTIYNKGRISDVFYLGINVCKEDCWVTNFGQIDMSNNLFFINQFDSLLVQIEEKCKNTQLTNIRENSLFSPCKTVFISHSHSDNKSAERAYNYLRAEGIKCWIDLHDIPPGKHYSEAIYEGIMNSQAFVVLFSKNAESSTDMLGEIEIAHRNKKRIIPVMLDSTTPSGGFGYYLSLTQWIHWQLPFEERMQKIVDGLKGYDMEHVKPKNHNNINLIHKITSLLTTFINKV